MVSWILPAALGIGLSAATGFRTFLPLLILALCAHFNLFGQGLNARFAWLGSTTALIALGVATVVEMAADKIPVLDHGLSAIGTVSRPLAGALAAGAVLQHADPAVAVIAGLIIGAPTALAVHAVQASTRVVSTTTTAGLANPFIFVAEDVASAILAVIVPILAPVVVVILLVVAWRVSRAFRRRPAAPQTST